MKRDDRTLDLLSWEPSEVAPAFPENFIRTATLRDRIACTVAEVLRECETSRDDVAAEMARFLGEPVPKVTLDQYASQAREDQTISLLRAVALASATGDVRALQAAIEPLGYVMVEQRWLPAIREAQIRAKMEELRAEADLAQRSWRGARR